MLFHSRACESLDSSGTTGPVASCCGLYLSIFITLVGSPVVRFVVLIGYDAGDSTGMQVYLLL